MDSTSLLWTFDEKMGEQDLDFCTGNVTEGDISMIFSSMARPVLQNNTGNQSQIAPGSYGLAPTPPPKEQEIKCPMCRQDFSSPKVLACFHSFCKKCIEQQLIHNDHVICPVCHTQTLLTPHLGVDGLLNDYGLENICNNRLHNAAGNVSTDEDSPKGSSGTPTEEKGLIFGSPSSTSSTPPRAGSPGNDTGLNNNVSCVSCTTGDRVVSCCCMCGFLCSNCQYAHQTMHCFEGHKLIPVPSNRGEHSSSESSSNSSFTPKSGAHCLEHRSQPLRYFCSSCNLAICEECMTVDHIQPTHMIESIDVIADQQVKRMEFMVDEAAKKQQEVLDSFRVIDNTQNRLHIALQVAQATINDNCDMLVGLISEYRQIMFRNVELKFGMKQLQLTQMDKEVQKLAKKMSQMIEFTRRLLNYSSPTEIMVFKPLIDSRIDSFLKFNIDHENIVKNAISGCEVQCFSADACRTTLSDLFARTGVDLNVMQQNGESSPMGSTLPHVNSVCGSMGRTSSRQNVGSPTVNGSYDMKNLVAQTMNGVANSPVPMLGTSAPAGGLSEQNNMMYDKIWSLDEGMTSLSLGSDMDNQLSQSLPYQLYPPRSQIKRQKMIYYCKFGEFGVIEGQFTEPSGVAVNAQNDIIVADTNNHRIQVFDKEGRFKFQFGECGKRDGQLLYPNRVAVNRVTGDYIVTERSPTHQIQIFNQYGQFMRKFGANILQHPRGLCVDSQGRIIVVECKVMRVIIFDSYGNVINKFSCSRYLEFPNGVCATSNNEILISDNRAHCIKVFSYEGQYLRQIGGEGITNYPIGVGINSRGEVVVADNHNNFNLTIFDQKGNMLNALESKVKHAQCFDMALVDDGSVVLASKDYRLYLYRYVTPLSI